MTASLEQKRREYVEYVEEMIDEQNTHVPVGKRLRYCGADLGIENTITWVLRSWVQGISH